MSNFTEDKTSTSTHDLAVLFWGDRPRVASFATRRPAPSSDDSTIEIHSLDAVTSEDRTSIPEAVRQLCPRVRQMVIALPTDACLCANFPVGDLPPRNRAKLFIYRFEEHLPVAAEEVAMVFDQSTTNGKPSADAFGIAVLAAPLQQVVKELESAGIEVIAVVPASVAALDHAISSELASESKELYVWQDGAALELLATQGRRLTAWLGVPISDRDSLGPSLKSLCGHDTSFDRITQIGCDDVVQGGLRAVFADKVVSVISPPSLEHAVLKWAAANHVTASVAWFNLQTGPLSRSDRLHRLRTPLRIAFVATMLMAVTLAGVLLHRGHEYTRQASTSQTALDAIYATAIGRPANGADVRSRLASEVRRLAAVSGTSAGADLMSEQGSALADLASVLAAMPREGLRYRVIDLRVGPAGAVAMEGITRGHGDADAIAAGLRQQANLVVEPVRTEARATENAVAFTLTGNRAVNRSPVSQVGGVPR